MGVFFGLEREGTPSSILEHHNVPFWACFDVQPPFSSSLITSPSLSVPLPDFLSHLDSFLFRYFLFKIISFLGSFLFCNITYLDIKRYFENTEGVPWSPLESSGFLGI